MFPRPFWIKRLREAWQSVPIAWLAGVRRSGKSTLSQNLEPDQTLFTRMPRLYGFDTGFVSQARGWNPLRSDDCGLLWEHLVLEHLQANLPDLHLHHWRDKTGREVDFVLVHGLCDPSGIAT